MINNQQQLSAGAGEAQNDRGVNELIAFAARIPRATRTSRIKATRRMRRPLSVIFFYLHVSHAARHRTTKTVAATRNADRASRPPPSIICTRQNSLAGW